MTKNQAINIALVCTQGGHFEQMTNLSDFFNCYNHFWMTNRCQQTESRLRNEKAYYIEMAHFKRPWAYLYQVVPVLKVFAREKPTHVISTGSGRTALIPFLLSKLFKVKFIYIDTFSKVQGHSMFGTFLLKTRNKIYTQWDGSRNKRAIYIGPIIKPSEDDHHPRDSKHVFVTVGTRTEPFTRLLKAVEDAAKRGIVKEKIIIQAGHTQYNSDRLEIFDYCSPEKIRELISKARYVITQESAGIGTQCLKNRTRFIVMPREYQYGELPSKSDMIEDLHFKLEKLGYTKVVRNSDELEKAILNIENLKTGFDFNNSLAISILHRAMEEL